MAFRQLTELLSPDRSSSSRRIFVVAEVDLVHRRRRRVQAVDVRRPAAEIDLRADVGGDDRRFPAQFGLVDNLKKRRR